MSTPEYSQYTMALSYVTNNPNTSVIIAID
jgi:hypothetical protein